MSRISRITTVFLTGFVFTAYHSNPQDISKSSEETNYITYHKIDKAWALSKGENIRVAVLDWLFNIKSDPAHKYVDPVSLVPGQDIGVLEPWHGEWMATIIHTIAPASKIIPIRARPKSVPNEDSMPERPYEKYVIEGIRYAADHGAAAVTSSMGPVKDSPELDEAVAYAAKKGTIFVDVHPEYLRIENKRYVFCDSADLNPLIVHSGIVSVPDHPREIDPLRDVCTWPYDIDPVFQDGWGYSNGPPIVAGVIALMKSVNSSLTVPELKDILKKTARMDDGFRVLDAEAAVKEALRIK